MDRWYEPPSALTDWRAPSAPPCITVPHCSKVQHSDQYLYPSSAAQPQAFSRFVQDYLVFGNAYLENARTDSVKLSLLSLRWQNTPARIRPGYLLVCAIRYDNPAVQFTKGSIFHLMEPDINQEI